MCLPAGSVAINPLARMYGRRALEVASTVEQLWPWRACASFISVYNMGSVRWEEEQEAIGEAEAAGRPGEAAAPAAGEARGRERR